MKQLQTIYGTAGPRAAVQVVDRQGEIIAETTADASGKWSIEAAVTIGASVRADVTNNGGRKTTSDWLTIERQIVAAEPEESAEERVLREQQAAETAAIRRRLEGYYTDLVCAMCDGHDVDFEYVADLLAALDRSITDFDRDVTAMQRATFHGALNHVLVRAKLNTLGERATY